jgi:hypothetical protein
MCGTSAGKSLSNAVSKMSDVVSVQSSDQFQFHLWVPRISSTLCDHAVFVDHAADARVSLDTVLLKIDRFG